MAIKICYGNEMGKRMQREAIGNPHMCKICLKRVDEVTKYATGGIVLDVGCGEYALWHDSIRAKFPDSFVIGLEINSKILRDREGDYIAADAERLPFRNGIFDLVVAGELLEHVINPRLAMAEFYRVLKDSGRIGVTTPNDQQLHVFFRLLIGKPSGDLGRSHNTPFTFWYLTKLLKTNGFKEVEVYSIILWIPLLQRFTERFISRAGYLGANLIGRGIK
jgi:ubiquinone/menaquinone biosynthesis C-methylase UbiE